MKQQDAGRSSYPAGRSREAHWTEEQLLDRLYGLEPEDEAARLHFAICSECRQRAAEYEAFRARTAQTPALPETFFAAQRAEIRRRLEVHEKQGLWGTPVAPVLASAALLLVALWLHHPVPAPTVQVSSVSDSEFFSQVYEEVYQSDLKGAETVIGLFEEVQ